MAHFFISYNKADGGWAEWIAWQLEEAGYSTILQAWDFRPGGNFVLDMQAAAAKAERTIALLSPEYLEALYTHPEWAAAFAKDPTGQGKTLVPVMIRACDLEGLLPQITYIDLRGLIESDARETLLRGVRVGRAKPGSAPAFPGAGVHAAAAQPPYPGAGPIQQPVAAATGGDLKARLAIMYGSARKQSLAIQRDKALIEAIDTGLAGGRPDLVADYPRELDLAIQRDEQYRRIIDALIDRRQLELAQSLADRLTLSIERDRYHAKIVEAAKHG